MTDQRFSTALESNYEYLFHFARKLTGSESDAQDLVQNTALKAYRNRNKLDDIKNFKAWITTILYNIFVSDYHKRRRREELLALNGTSDAFFYNVSSCINQGYDNLKTKDLISITRKAGRKSYEAFELYLIGYSYQEIADNLEIAIGTVKSRINFVRTKIKDLYQHLNIAEALV